MDANGLQAGEKIPASRKLGKKDAAALLKGASKLIVAKGKKVQEWKLDAKVPADAVAAMLGPTGNLRAPTLVVGKTVLVGFNEDVFEAQF